MEQHNIFFESMWRLSGNRCFVTFCTLGYCVVLEKVTNKLINQFNYLGLSSAFNYSAAIQQRFIASPRKKVGIDLDFQLFF